MKVEVKIIDTTKRELQFEIPKERVAEFLDEVYVDISKKAKVKGFRPGKIPRNILESKYSQLAREEALKKIVPDAYQEAIQQEKLSPIDYPEINDVSFKDGAVQFKALIDIKPDVAVKDYLGIKVKRKSTEVTDADIDKTLDYFKQGQGKDKDVSIDDEFAKGLGYPDLVQFKESLKKQLELDKERQSKSDVENQIVEYLLKKSKFALPKSLVDKQMEQRLAEERNRLKSQQVPEEEIQKREEDIRKQLKEVVEKDVKVYLIFDKIAQLENIQLNEKDNMVMKVMEFLLKQAQWA
ncbi:MAG: hypothetical protein K8S27_08210 [Candidatus Omnitrophica bacterium]|nr:hypothetical protein [Candidatus Omnitrophota bacterium]